MKKRLVALATHWFESLVDRIELRRDRANTLELARKNQSAWRLASDPNASADDLSSLIREVLEEVHSCRGRDEWGMPLLRVLDSWKCPEWLCPAGFLIPPLAANPNTPPDLIVSLLRESPRLTLTGLLRNPVLPLLPLEVPDLFERLATYLPSGLVRSPNLTAELAGILAFHPNSFTAWEARSSVALSGEFRPDTDWRDAMERETFELARSSPFPDLLLDLAEFGLVPEAALPPTDSRFDNEELYYNIACAARTQGYTTLPDVKALDPETDLRSLIEIISYDGREIASYDSVLARWVVGHPNADRAVISAWFKLLVTAAFYEPGSPAVACIVLNALPTMFWRSLPMLPDEPYWPLLPDPWTICRSNRFGPLERCAAIPHLNDPPVNQDATPPYSEVIQWLLTDNNRYVRAAARERFGK
jgi:hypothetical protein